MHETLDLMGQLQAWAMTSLQWLCTPAPALRIITTTACILQMGTKPPTAWLAAHQLQNAGKLLIRRCVQAVQQADGLKLLLMTRRRWRPAQVCLRMRHMAASTPHIVHKGAC
jgi:hypothetical protein